MIRVAPFAIIILLLLGNAVEAAIKVKWQYDDVHQREVVFPGERPQALAVTVRGGYIWIVFDGDVNITNFYEWKNADPDFDVTRLEINDATVIRIRHNGFKDVTVTKHYNDWRLTASKLPKLVQENSSSVLEHFAENDLNQVYIGGGMAGKIVNVMDPDIGDNLAIIPYFDNVYNARAKKYLGAEVLKSSQGLFISQISDFLTVSKHYENVLITLPILNKLLTSNVDEIQISEQQHLSLLWFDTNTWRNVDDPNFKSYEQALWKELSQTPRPASNHIKWILAKFYFSRGMYTEASSVIDLLRRTPEYKDLDKIDLMKAVCFYKFGDYDAAFQELKKANDNALTEDARKEIDFWIAVVELKKQFTNKPVNLDYEYNRFLKFYPDALVLEIAAINLDHLLAREDIKEGGNILRKLSEQNGKLAYYTTFVLYDTIFYAVNGSVSSIDELKRISTTSEDNKIRAYSRFYYLLSAHRHGLITNNALLEEFPKIALLQRGEPIEHRILYEHGNYLIKNHQYIEGLRTWRLLLNNFPQQKMNLELISKMSGVFADAIINPNVEMSSYDVVLFYEEFKELTPIGEKSDYVVNNIIEHLVNLELLDQAAELLSHQIQFRLNEIKKPLAINRLARIYLDNRQPLMAIDLLDFYENRNLPRYIQDDRRHLRAEGLLMTKRYVDVLDLLITDFSLMGGDIKSTILWENSDWENLRILLEPRILALQTSNLPLTPSQEIDVLLHTITLTALNNYQDLVFNFKRLVPRISNKSVADVVTMLSWQHLPVDYLHLDQSIGIENVRRFLSNLDQVSQDLEKIYNEG